MSTLGNYIQIIVRGLVNGEQWQISPTWSVTSIEGVVGQENFTFPQAQLVEWFDRVWNGGGGIGTADGMGDKFRELLTTKASIDEVRVLARTRQQGAPTQLIYAAELTGTRAVGAGNFSPSYMAASCFAQADDFGIRGASFRLPAISDLDHDGNFFDATALARYRDGILDTMDNNPRDGELVVSNQYGELVTVEGMQTSVVKRVFGTPTGEGPSATKRKFPYESPWPIFARTCTTWQVHDWVSTQNSRKFGRGS